jgi:DNA-directed RNA polymerase, mitochondrial
MRMKESSEQNSYLKEADSRGSMELVYAGLDVLGKTAWKINKAVFDVTLEVWNKGLDYPSIPPLNLKQTMPDPPPDTTDMKAKTDYAVALKKLAQERSAHHSDRCSTNYKLEIARTVSYAMQCALSFSQLLPSSLARNSTSPTTLISVDAHIQYRLI